MQADRLSQFTSHKGNKNKQFVAIHSGSAEGVP